MEEENVATRLKLLLDDKKLSTSQFADLCGIPRPSFSQVLSGRNKKISDVLLTQIHTQFPDVSVVWLLFGEGKMYTDSSENTQSEPKFKNENNIFSDIDADENLFSKEIPLEEPVFAVENVKPQHDIYAEKCKELQQQIDAFKSNPRKVVQVIVYYDDNTFETFKSS